MDSPSSVAPRRTARRAITIIELLVVVMVIGLLLALLLPAIQAAREASRRAQCTNNLKQIVTAMHAYEAATQSLPGGSRLSPQALILPYLDQIALYDSINVEQASEPVPSWVRGNETAHHTQLAVFLCPSDESDPRRPAVTNYAANYGVGFEGTRQARNGLFGVSPRESIRLGSVTDGLSNTAAFAEWCIGRAEGSRDPLRVVFQTPIETATEIAFEDFVEECRLKDRRNPIDHWRKGEDWLMSQSGRTGYNHTLSPNMNTCRAGTYVDKGAWTAGSQHPGGGHVALADGHVRFVKRSVTPAVWRAIGSRNGGEILPLDAVGR